MRRICGLSVMKVSLRVLACLVVMFDTAAFLFLTPYYIIPFKKYISYCL